MKSVVMITTAQWLGNFLIRTCLKIKEYDAVSTTKIYKVILKQPPIIPPLRFQRGLEGAKENRTNLWIFLKITYNSFNSTVF